MRVPGSTTYVGVAIVECDMDGVALRIGGAGSRLSPGDAFDLAGDLRSRPKWIMPEYNRPFCSNPNAVFRSYDCELYCPEAGSPSVIVANMEFCPDDPEGLALALEEMASYEGLVSEVVRTTVIGKVTMTSDAVIRSLGRDVEIAVAGDVDTLDPGEASDIAFAIKGEGDSDRLMKGAGTFGLKMEGAMFFPDYPERLAKALAKASKKARRFYEGSLLIASQEWEAVDGEVVFQPEYACIAITPEEARAAADAIDRRTEGWADPERHTVYVKHIGDKATLFLRDICMDVDGRTAAVLRDAAAEAEGQVSGDDGEGCGCA